MDRFVLQACRSVALLASLFVADLVAIGADSFAPDLKTHYANKEWLLTGSYSDDRLSFDSSGRVQGMATPGRWMLDSGLQVTDVAFVNGQLRVKGRRLLLYGSNVGLVYQPTKRRVLIVAQLDPAHTTLADVDALWSTIFATHAQHFVERVPDFWKPCVSAALIGSGGEPYNVCRLGGFPSCTFVPFVV